MKLTFNSERILAVIAHPDDAELFCGGTLARAKAEGATVGICVMCQGDKGQPSEPVPKLAAVRRKEMKASAKILGAGLFFGEYPDGSLDDLPDQRQKLLEFIRQFSPTLLLAHSAEDYHPDHRAVSRLVDAASWYCASRGQKGRSKALNLAPAIWWMDTLDMNGFTPGFYVDVSEYVPVKTRMLACHQSQLARGKDMDFSPLAELMRTRFRTRGLQSGVDAAEAFRAHLSFKRLRAW